MNNILEYEQILPLFRNHIRLHHAHTFGNAISNIDIHNPTHKYLLHKALTGPANQYNSHLRLLRNTIISNGFGAPRKIINKYTVSPYGMKYQEDLNSRDERFIEQIFNVSFNRAEPISQNNLTLHNDLYIIRDNQQTSPMPTSLYTRNSLFKLIDRRMPHPTTRRPIVVVYHVNPTMKRMLRFNR